MLIALTGSLCSGKEQVCQWLVDECHFERLYVHDSSSSSSSRDDDTTTTTTTIHGPSKSVEELMRFLMQDGHWQRDYVVSPLLVTAEELQLLMKRPFFQLVSVDAPMECRYQRYLEKYHQIQGHDTTRTLLPKESWFQFMRETDRQLGMRSMMLHASAQVLHNPYATTQELHAYLRNLQPSLADPVRLRPGWDDYFMLLADLASHRSNCMKRRVGCIVVREGRVIATGYNGTPRGLRNCNEGGCERCNKGAPNNTSLGECLCMHAEENALLEAGRERVCGSSSSGSKAIVYCNTCPCLGCAKKMIQVGVGEVVYRMEYGMDSKVKEILKAAGVSVRQHHPATVLHLRAAADPFGMDQAVAVLR